MNTQVAVYTESKTTFEQLTVAAEGTEFVLHLNPDWNLYKENHFIICSR